MTIEETELNQLKSIKLNMKIDKANRNAQEHIKAQIERKNSEQAKHMKA